jgi:hypothetical protein
MKFYAKFEEKSSIGKGFKERAQNAWSSSMKLTLSIHSGNMALHIVLIRSTFEASLNKIFFRL